MSQYVPGVCNIGDAERATRRRVGHMGALITALTLLFIAFDQIPTIMRAGVGIPVGVMAYGYLQAALGFCARYGLAGVFNVSAHEGRTQEVQNLGDRAADRRRARLIILLSVLSGLAGATIGVLLPSPLIVL